MDAPSVAAFEKEAEGLASRPHLAVYWLLHHLVAGNASSLVETFALTERIEDPWVVEVRGALVNAQARDTFPKFVRWDRDVCEHFEEYAPEDAIE